MRTVTDADELICHIGAILPGAKLTNGLPDAETLRRKASSGILSASVSEDGILLYEKADGFLRLRYLLKNEKPLIEADPGQTTVVEAAFRSGDGKVNDLFSAIAANGWRRALNRVRLTRPAGHAQEAEDEQEPYVPSPEEALGWLKSCFSPLTGCLPTEEEIREDVADGRLLSYRGALLRFKRSGNVTEIRQLAVLPEYRRQGLGRALVRRYLSLCGDKKCRVWTGEDNAAALSLYESAGFVTDGMCSAVAVREPGQI